MGVPRRIGFTRLAALGVAKPGASPSSDATGKTASPPGRVLINAQIGGPLGGQSGKHLLILSLSAFDPLQTWTSEPILSQMRVRSKICAWLGFPVRRKPRHFIVYRSSRWRSAKAAGNVISKPAGAKRQSSRGMSRPSSPLEDAVFAALSAPRPNGDKVMFRTLVISTVLGVTTMVLAQGSAAAQGRWCAQYSGGSTNCGFNTYRQCRSDVRGVGGSCRRNLSRR
jgi:hypothetical protein